MKLIFSLHLLMIVLSLNMFAQISEHSDKKLNNHEHHKNEIGIANSPIYFLNEKVFAYGLHFHYVRNISKSRFGIGFGYEKIFDIHKHNTLGFVAAYSPIEKLSFNISPGLTFEDKISNSEFAIHIESSYEFEIKDFHIGPVFEFAYDSEDVHLSLGIHIGYGF